MYICKRFACTKYMYIFIQYNTIKHYNTIWQNNCKISKWFTTCTFFTSDLGHIAVLISNNQYQYVAHTFMWSTADMNIQGTFCLLHKTPFDSPPFPLNSPIQSPGSHDTVDDTLSCIYTIHPWWDTQNHRH